MFSMTLRAYQSLLVGGVGASVARFSGTFQMRRASTKSFDVAKSKRLLLSPPFACGSVPALQQFNYIDKTALLARIMSTQATFLIATSMRRSGKSLVLNQLAEMARGNRALFKGYEVTKNNSPFKIGAVKYPLMRLDFTSLELDHDASNFDAAMKWQLLSLFASSALSQHNIKLDISPQSLIGKTFEDWVSALRSKAGDLPIVLLIDEYDAPITSCFDIDLTSKPGWNAGERSQSMALILKQMYLATKRLENCFHKVFVTGASLGFECLLCRDLCLFSASALSRSLFPLLDVFLLTCGCLCHFRRVQDLGCVDVLWREPVPESAGNGRAVLLAVRLHRGGGSRNVRPIH